MNAEFERQTVKSDVRFEGVGIHSGAQCVATVRPGKDGIVFTAAAERVRAEPKNVTDTKLRTTRLGNVGMIEHLMSAFAALEITDAEVEVVGPELPILDGSAKEYFCGLKDVGMGGLGASKRVHIFSRVNVQGENQERIGISAGTGRWRFDWQREGHWPGQQSYEAHMPEDYADEVAPARTFCHEDEIEKIRAAGLGKGGNEENTLVIGAEGYLTESRFADEPPRHKLIDLIGDVMLAGIPPRFLNVVAERSGHALNVEAAARLVEVCTWEELS